MYIDKFIIKGTCQTNNNFESEYKFIVSKMERQKITKKRPYGEAASLALIIVTHKIVG